MNATPSGFRIPKPALLAFSLVCLSLSLGCGLGWLHARQEVSLLSTELQFAHAELRGIRQQLEAERLIGRRQIEMLREQQAPSPKP